ncbi:hypothetical protein FHG08_15825 [Pseudoalteromonas sp. Scap03]|uniref:hypothetical protein n=1 Tax=unclassified Pseudoalteromonas TaxID=194690 RepID=UPI0015B7A47D|nr:MULTISPECIES: hypothetical protein [unclassified Pseudoalteromonas]NWL17118.1 hypothetical protein [Pseudoalteromonas sp. Scap03]QLE83162.1 hypothetical protein FLM54_16665 [Pseudoalteromonas sp. Scap25]QLE91104.1 hypothetical protein FLM47_16675 [Pseudoalteromonas sp. Scap06]
MQSTTTNTEYTASPSALNEQKNNAVHTDESKYQFVPLTKNESSFLNKKRKSWKFANPKDLYTFRDQPVGIFNHLLHIVIFLVCLFLLISIYYLPFDQEFINGVGSYNTITPFERFSRTLLVGLILFNLNSLRVNLKAYPIKRYWFAMAANSLLKVVILNIYYLLLIFLSMAFVGASKGVDLFSALEMLEDSTNYEQFLIFDTFISFGIIWHAFKFCRKEVKQ